MYITTYCEKARSTAEYSAPFIYPTHGLAGEIGELLDKLTDTDVFVDKDSIVKEMGDVLWYIVNIAADVEVNFNDVALSISLKPQVGDFTELGAQMKQSNDLRPALVKLPIYSGRINEIAKKIIRDNDGTFRIDQRLVVAETLAELLICLFKIGSSWCINLDDVAQVNIDKLSSRKERGVIQGSGDNR